MLGQLDFADFLRSPGGHDEHQQDPLNFSLIPPTPQDRFPSHSFASHDFLVTPIDTERHPFGDEFPRARGIGSPPPPLGGLLAPNTTRPQLPARSTSLRAPSTHSRSSSIASTASIRHEPYKRANRRTSGSSFSSNGNASTYSTSYQSDTSATGLAERLHIGGNNISSADAALTAINTGCIDQSAMMSLCPGEMMQPMANGSMTTSNGETISLQTPWTTNQLTEDTSDEEDSDEEDAPGEEDSNEDVRPTIHNSGDSSDDSEESGSEYAEDSDDEPVKPKKAAPAAVVRKGGRARARPMLQRDDEPILVTAITASGKKSHARKRPIDHIPRPRNAFILFRKHVVDSKLIPPEVEIRHQNISVVVSKMWAEADKDTKFRFQESARKEKEEHMRNYPDYKYQPVYRRANVARRKLKVDPIEEKKCEVVASLLIEGKQGEELENGASKAVKAADKRRVAQAAKLQALRKSASQNSLRREKAVAKSKRIAASGQNSAVSSARSSPAPRASEQPRNRQTLFPLAEQLLQSSAIVIQGQKAVEQAQLEGHQRARSSISSMREMLPPSSQASTSYSSSLAASTPQTNNGMMMQQGHQPMMYQTRQQQQQPQQQYQSMDPQQQFLMPQQYQYAQPQQHQQLGQQSQQIYVDNNAQVAHNYGNIGTQQYMMDDASQGGGAQSYGFQSNNRQAPAKNDPPSHYVLQLLSQGQNNGMDLHGGHMNNGQMISSGQGMYEMDLTGYSEALAQMAAYGNM